MQAEKFDHRMWNRDMAACRNFLHIIFSLYAEIPERFRQSIVASRKRRHAESTE
jgi:hypothetical protein